LEPEDKLVLRLLRSNDGLASNFIAFDSEESLLEGGSPVDDILLDLLSSYTHFGSREQELSPEESVVDLETACILSVIELESGKMDAWGNPVHKSQSKLIAELRRKGLFVSVNEYITFVKNSPGKLEVKIADGEFWPDESPSGATVRRQSDFLRDSLTKRSERYSKIRKRVTEMSIGMLGDLPDIPPWGSVPTSCPTQDSLRSGQAGDYAFLSIADLSAKGFPPYRRAPGMILTKKPPLRQAADGLWSQAWSGYVPPTSLAAFLEER
jgi:hypothetical protein